MMEVIRNKFYKFLPRKDHLSQSLLKLSWSCGEGKDCFVVRRETIEDQSQRWVTPLDTTAMRLECKVGNANNTLSMPSSKGGVMIVGVVLLSVAETECSC